MTTQAQGQLTKVRYIKESTPGTTPGTPTMLDIRHTKADLDLTKQIYRSNDMRGDRQINDVRHGFRQVDGSLECELSVGNSDDFIESGMGASSTGTTPTTGSTTLAAVASGNKITRGSGSFVTDGFLAGDEVTLSGFSVSGNNGRTKILTVTALELDVVKTLTDDSAASGCTVALVGHRYVTGTTLTTFTIERAFTDVNQFQQFLGCAVDQMNVQIKPGGMAMVTFKLLGMDETKGTATVASTVTAAPTAEALSVYDTVIYSNGVLANYVTDIEFKQNNNRKVDGVLGQKISQTVYEGESDLTLTVTFLFPDATEYNHFFNETFSSLDVLLNDPDGTNFLRFYAPKIKPTTGKLPIPKDGAVKLTMDFQAVLDATTGTNFIFQKSN